MIPELSDTGDMRSQLESAYLRHYYAGRSASARLFDRALFCALVFASVFAFSKAVTRKTGVSLLIGAIGCAVFLLSSDVLFKTSFARSVRELREKAAENVLKRKLLLAPTEELLEEVRLALHPADGERICVFQKVMPISEDELFEALRGLSGPGPVCLVSVSGFCSEAKSALGFLHSFDIKAISADGIPGLSAAYKPTENEIDEAIAAECSRRTRRAFTGAVKPRPVRALKYFLLAAAMYAFTFAAGAGVFLRGAAAAAAAAAAIAGGIMLVKRRSA